MMEREMPPKPGAPRARPHRNARLVLKPTAMRLVLKPTAIWQFRDFPTENFDRDAREGNSCATSPSHSPLPVIPLTLMQGYAWSALRGCGIEEEALEGIRGMRLTKDKYRSYRGQGKRASTTHAVTRSYPVRARVRRMP